MVKVKIGNILNCEEDIIVHQVNVQGIMGGGVARQLADRFKYLEENYSLYCKDWGNSYSNLFGDVYFYISDKIIANMFSQEPNFNTDYESMKMALERIKGYAECHNLSIAIPYGIGCGIANGEWNKVYKIIEEVFSDYDVTLYKLEGK